VVNVSSAGSTIVDPERLLIEAEAALARAKQNGRNRVEVVDGSAAATRALPHNSPSA
jgi:hypothetical protein